jgi:acyl carrier protein
MNVQDQIKQQFGYRHTESIESWLTRIVSAFLNINCVPNGQSLISLGASSISVAILIDLVKKETGADVSLSEAMSNFSSIAYLEKKILDSESTFPVIKRNSVNMD